MRTVHLSRCGLIVMLFLAVWNIGQAQDSLGMHHVATLDYWQGASDVQMVGNLAYVVSGTSGLRIMDLTDPTNPVEIGRCTWYDWDDASGGVYVTGTRAYVATTYGCCAFDISDPTDPVQLARWWGDRSQHDIFVHDSTAIIQGEDTQVIADISDLENVQQIGDFGHRMMWPLGMMGEYLCMACWDGGLLVFDISNPSQPVQVAQVDTTMPGGLGMIVGDYAYFGTLYDGVRIIDLSNPLQPVEVASCDSGWCCNLTVTNGNLVISRDDGYLDIWNVADPVQPVLEGVLALTSSFMEVAGSGNLICLAYYYDPMSVAVVDISNPAAPVQVSSFGLVGFLGLMKINGTTGYVGGASFPGSGGRGLCIMDLADPVNPSFLGIVHGAGDVAMRGNYLYSVDRYHGMVVFDVSNPAEPESLHCTPGGCLRRIVIEGDYAYVISTDQGYPVSLFTFSLLDPVAPVQVNSLSVPHFTLGDAFGAQNGYLYLGADNASYVYLFVYGLANPEAPQLVGTGYWPNVYWTYPHDLALTEHYAYVADYTGGLVTVDITQPENPVVVGHMEGTTICELAAIGNTVVTDGNSRINVLDMSDPTDPRYVGYYSTVEVIRDIKILGSHVITISSCEFRVYQCDALPVIPPHPEIIPHKFDLLPPFPNPFNSMLTILFTIPIQKEVIINIYNILGQKVQEFALPPQLPGMHRVVWNSGSCASGIYVVRLLSDGKEFNQKVVLLK